MTGQNRSIENAGMLSSNFMHGGKTKALMPMPKSNQLKTYSIKFNNFNTIRNSTHEISQPRNSSISRNIMEVNSNIQPSDIVDFASGRKINNMYKKENTLRTMSHQGYRRDMTLSDNRQITAREQNIDISPRPHTRAIQ